MTVAAVNALDAWPDGKDTLFDPSGRSRRTANFSAWVQTWFTMMAWLMS